MTREEYYKQNIAKNAIGIEIWEAEQCYQLSRIADVLEGQNMDNTAPQTKEKVK